MKYLYIGTNFTLRRYTDPGSTAPITYDWEYDHGYSVYAVAVDSLGNSYLAGQRIGGVTHRKIDPDGNLVWSADHGADVRGIAVDADFNVYIVGNSSGGVHFRKYNSSGVEQWNKSLTVNFRGVTVADDGYIYICGDTTGSINVRRYNPDGTQPTPNSWGLPTTSTIQHQGISVKNGFIHVAHNNISSTSHRKYTTAGGFQWSKAHANTMRAVVVNNAGDAWFGGSVASSVTVRKYNSGGTQQWTYHNTGSGNVVWALVLDSDDNVFISQASGLVDKVDSSGNLVWSMSVGLGSTAIALLDVNPKFLTGSNNEISIGAFGDTLKTGKLVPNPLNIDISTFSDLRIYPYRSWNPLDKDSYISLSDYKLTATLNDNISSIRCVRATVPINRGKYYWELSRSIPSIQINVGVCTDSAPLYNPLGNQTWAYIRSFTNNWISHGGVGTNIGSSLSTGVIGIAVDMESRSIWIRDANGWYDNGNPETGANPIWSNLPEEVYPFVGIRTEINDRFDSITANFGDSEFVYLKPNNFDAYNTPYQPQLSATSLISINSYGVLTGLTANLPIGSASISINSSSPYMSSPRFSGNAGIEISASLLTNPVVIDGTLTFLASADSNLGIIRMGDVLLELPAPVVYAYGFAGQSGVILRLPVPEITALSGGLTAVTLPAPLLSATGDVPGFATALLELPEPVLVSSGLAGAVATVTLPLLAPTLTAWGGGFAALDLPAVALSAAGQVTAVGHARLELPFPILQATGRVAGIGHALLELPAPIIDAGLGNYVELAIPAPRVAATGIAPSSLSPEYETTYAVNLSSGAITQLLLGHVERLVLANGRLYALRDGKLWCLEGKDDDGVAIAATVRFAQQTFGTQRVKRLTDVYLSARESDGVTLEVVADEWTVWRYQTEAGPAPRYGAHKVKVGRGVTFHTAGLVVRNRDGGALDIGGIEPRVEELSRNVP